MLDEYGNLSLDAIMSYVEDHLSVEDRAKVEDHAAKDEMSREALEGYALSTNTSRTRHLLSELHGNIAATSGAKAVSTGSKRKNSHSLPALPKLAAAFALLVVGAIAVYFIAQSMKEEPIAEQTESEPSATREQFHEPIERQVLPADTASAKQEGEEKELETVADQVDEKNAPSETIKEALPEKAEPDRTRTEPVAEPPAEEPIAEKQKTDRSAENTTANETISEKPAPDAESEVDEVAQVSEVEDDEVDTMAKMSAGTEQVSEMAAESISATSETASVPASFPGGDMAMYRFFEKRKNYTEAMKAQGLKGKVSVSFDIGPDGRIVNVKIKKGVAGLLDQDAVRVIRSMPEWTPAMQDGEPEQSSRTVVISYGE